MAAHTHVCTRACLVQHVTGPIQTYLKAMRHNTERIGPVATIAGLVVLVATLVALPNIPTAVEVPLLITSTLAAAAGLGLMWLTQIIEEILSPADIDASGNLLPMSATSIRVIDITNRHLTRNLARRQVR